MWLVIAHYTDLSGIWLYNEIKKRYPNETEIITAEALPYLLHWNHRVGNEGDAVSFTLPSGKAIRSSEIKGVINRLSYLNLSMWRKMGQTDQMYVSQEHAGLYCSWLASLNCKVYNRPTPNGLSGVFRQQAEWYVAASRAGLPTPKYEMDSNANAAQNATSAPYKTALIFNGQVFGMDDVPELVDGCRKLAKMSGLPMLGIQFAKKAEDGLEFQSATTIPELFDGGETLIESILHAN